jgi:hypothetical protein
MYLKRQVVDDLSRFEIDKYVLICENVLNFHGSDNCYYEEWFEDIKESNGWMAFLNLNQHVEEEMVSTQIHHYAAIGGALNDVNWRRYKPAQLVATVDGIMNNATKQLLF